MRFSKIVDTKHDTPTAYRGRHRRDAVDLPSQATCAVSLHGYCQAGSFCPAHRPVHYAAYKARHKADR